MDFDIFWVIIILYFLFQVLGGRKKQKQRQRAAGDAERPSRPIPEQAEREPELDDALREIRRALGFPEEKPQPSREPVKETQTEHPPFSPPTTEEQKRQRPIPSVETSSAPGRTTAPRPSSVPGRTTPTAVPGSTTTPRPGSVPGRTAAPRPTEGLPRPTSAPRRTAAPRPAPASRIPTASSSPRPSTIAGHGSTGSVFEPPQGGAFGREQAFERLGRVSEPALKEHPIPAHPAEHPTKRRAQIAARLRNPSTAREAFLMKEILGPPRALRRNR